VRDDVYKLIDFGAGGRQLYNLESDPYKHTDLLQQQLDEDATTALADLDRIVSGLKTP
jgi:hypothetical protein